MLTGLFNSSFGFGAFSFTVIATNVVNPDGLSPTEEDQNGNKQYPWAVAKNVPEMI
jgi:hypothetical protein